MAVTASTLSGNSAGGNGGGILSDPGSVGVTRFFSRIVASTLSVTNSTISGNSAGGSGGGISSGGMLTIDASTFTANAAQGGGAGVYNSVGLEPDSERGLIGEAVHGTASIQMSLFNQAEGGRHWGMHCLDGLSWCAAPMARDRAPPYSFIRSDRACALRLARTGGGEPTTVSVRTR